MTIYFAILALVNFGLGLFEVTRLNQPRRAYSLRQRKMVPASRPYTIGDVVISGAMGTLALVAAFVS